MANLIFVIALTLGVASAVTQDELTSLRVSALPFIKSCADEYHISKESILATKNNENIDALDSCFYACFFKKVGVMNDAGLFDSDAFYQRNKNHFKGEDDLVKVAGIGKTCSAVNSASVSDGTKGCDRARMLVACLLKEKSDFISFTPV